MILPPFASGVAALRSSDQNPGSPRGVREPNRPDERFEHSGNSHETLIPGRDTCACTLVKVLERAHQRCVLLARHKKKRHWGSTDWLTPLDIGILCPGDHQNEIGSRAACHAKATTSAYPARAYSLVRIDPESCDDTIWLMLAV